MQILQRLGLLTNAQKCIRPTVPAIKPHVENREWSAFGEIISKSDFTHARGGGRGGVHADVHLSVRASCSAACDTSYAALARPTFEADGAEHGPSLACHLNVTLVERSPDAQHFRMVSMARMLVVASVHAGGIVMVPAGDPWERSCVVDSRKGAVMGARSVCHSLTFAWAAR